MDGHFRAFSFVDRIIAPEHGASIRGHYSIPPGLDVFPVSLVAEAIGQLAAWAAMAAVDFSHRPVAGIAGAVELLSDVRPGQELDLAAELEAVDAETLGYSGTANVGETPVIRLRDCVGPMVPTADFDDPQSLRDRFALLRTDGAVPGAFCGLPVLNLQLGPVKPGRSASAILHVPEDAPLFADHFPRRAVFPGTLLMHANLQTAALLAVEIPVRAGAAWEARVVSDVKLRNFIAPGERLNLEARQTDHTETDLTIAIESRINRRLIGSAHIRFTLEGRV